MTNHWVDIKNADCILIMGSNAAENHPISFKWVTKAMEERGAKLISVDPRQNRTTAKAEDLLIELVDEIMYRIFGNRVQGLSSAPE